MKIALRSLLLCLLMLGMSLAVAAQDIAVIQLRNRPAEDLQPLLLPMLNGNDSLVPNHMQLIIKADPATIREIRGLVEQLDRRPHRLLISVAQGTNITAESLNAGIGVGTGPHGGVRVQGGIAASGRQHANRASQTVQTLDGQLAMIQAGEDVPSRQGYGYGYGAWVEIGGLSQSRTSSGYGPGYASRQESGRIFVKVDDQDAGQP